MIVICIRFRIMDYRFFSMPYEPFFKFLLVIHFERTDSYSLRVNALLLSRGSSLWLKKAKTGQNVERIKISCCL
jgi:hypothetical protein